MGKIIILTGVRLARIFHKDTDYVIARSEATWQSLCSRSGCTVEIATLPLVARDDEGDKV